WIAPGKGWIDPVKEVQASQLAIETGISTLADEAAANGKDWEEVLEQQKRELTKRLELGLPLRRRCSRFCRMPRGPTTPSSRASAALRRTLAIPALRLRVGGTNESDSRRCRVRYPLVPVRCRLAADRRARIRRGPDQPDYSRRGGRHQRRSPRP